MHQQTNFPMIKKLMIESQSGNGRCYLRLVPLIRSFHEISAPDLEDIIIEMIRILGPNPVGMNVFKALYLADCTARGEIDSGLSLELDDVTIPTSFIEHVMESPIRFGFEELGGVLHVTYYLLSPDPNDSGDDSPIQSEFGWASRFVIQQMCNSDRRIGADDELDDLFGSILKVPQNENIYHESNYKNPKLYSSDQEVRETQSRVEDIYNRMEQKSSRQMFTDKENQDLRERLMRMEEKMQSLLTVKEQSVLPDDSSSNIGRYKKQFLPNGYSAGTQMPVMEEEEEESMGRDVQPVYVMSKGRTVLGVGDTITRPAFVKDVTVGFRKTNDMVKLENQVLSTIHPINGLATPFKSNRLNMLIHFHTAISNVLPKIGQSDYIRMMWYMNKYKATTPSEELAYQVVSKTFNLSEGVVIANPYKLPFIEIGMQVNDPTIVKCFTMLRNEYEQLWFEEMKHLWVPDFHSSFHQFTEGKLTGNNQRSRIIEEDQPSSRSRSNRNGHYERKRSKGSSSILSLR